MSNVASQEALVYRLGQELKQAQATLEELKTPPQPLGDMVRFSIQYEYYGKRYEYLAIKVGGRWFTTGATCPKLGYTWKQLLDLSKDAYWKSSIAELKYA